MWITQRFRTIAVFPINWERLDASVFTSMLPATRRKSRTCATRETDVISERKHCSRRRRHTQVELSSSRKCADKTQTIARKRWHGARKRKRSNVRSTCGRLNGCDVPILLLFHLTTAFCMRELCTHKHWNVFTLLTNCQSIFFAIDIHVRRQWILRY